MFWKKLSTKLFEYLNIENHTINLKKDKQQPYRLINSLMLVELKGFKIYISTNLVNNFIQLSKLSTRIVILFVIKLNSNFCL